MASNIVTKEELEAYKRDVETVVAKLLKMIKKLEGDLRSARIRIANLEAKN